MAISFIGSAENSGIGGADVTLTLPGGMQQDDLVIVAYGIGGDGAIDRNMVMLTSGYTEIADLFSNDTRDTNFGVFYKFMGATPDTTAQVEGFGTSGEGVSAVCMVFRGVNTTTPFDVASTTATGVSTMHPDPPSIDHLNPSGLWTVLAGTSGHGAGTQTYTFPTGYTTNAVDASADTVVDSATGMGYNTAPADPEDPGVMTLSGTDNAAYSWCAVTMALRPKAVITASIGQVTETDTPQAVAVNPRRRLALQVTETDSVQAFSRLKGRAVGQTIEDGVAQLMRVAKGRVLGQSTESDAAQSLVWAPKHRLALQAVETSLAQAMGRLRIVSLVQAVELDLAQALRLRMWSSVPASVTSWGVVTPDGSIWANVTPGSTAWEM